MGKFAETAIIDYRLLFIHIFFETAACIYMENSLLYIYIYAAVSNGKQKPR
jgi:hypothetical protein